MYLLTHGQFGQTGQLILLEFLESLTGELKMLVSNKNKSNTPS